MHGGGNFMYVRADRWYVLVSLDFLFLFWEVAFLTQNRQAIIWTYYRLRGCTRVNVRVRVLRRLCPSPTQVMALQVSLRYLFP